MAHSSWFTYAGMTRIYKHHEFALRHPAVRMQKASFSSYGGGPVASAHPAPTHNPDSRHSRAQFGLSSLGPTT